MSPWYANKKDYPKFIQEDYKIRNFIKKRGAQAAISSIEIKRMSEKLVIKINSARPGVIIGRHGSEIERLRNELSDIIKREFNIEIGEIKNASADSQLIAENISFQLIKRIAFKRAIKRAIDKAIISGVKGIKISCAGRLGGAEIARRETYKEGKIPLQTFRSDIDYGFAEALTTYGLIGIKVWVYKGDIIPGVTKKEPENRTKSSKK